MEHGWRAAAEHLRTPYKRREPVLQGSGTAGSFDEKCVDCPFVFRHNDRFYMMYVGFDGTGYQTALATSGNLTEWSFEGVILPRGDDSSRWDCIGAAGSWILLESDGLLEVPRLKKIGQKYWMVYHSYPDPGYEAGSARMGLAWCEDEDLLSWHRLEKPVLSYEDGKDWERAGLYKCCVVQAEGQYWMFYNAKDKTDWPWIEETGLAVSKDLCHWERHPDNPLLRTRKDSFYSHYFSDPCLKFDETSGFWVNFGFGFDGIHARGALAVSPNLADWEILPFPWLETGPPGELDETHAHKSSVIFWQDTLYHFYCACRPGREEDKAVIRTHDGENGEFRCIALATSKPLNSTV